MQSNNTKQSTCKCGAPNILNEGFKECSKQCTIYGQPDKYHNDYEGKYEGDSRAGRKNPENTQQKKEDDGKAFAQAYQKTGFGKAMDDKNKEALDVMAKEGSDSAAHHMINMAGGDYARMRSMYG